MKKKTPVKTLDKKSHHTPNTLIERGITWIREHKRWPTAHDMSGGPTEIKHFGSWSTYKRTLIEKYRALYGTPDWDVTAPKRGNYQQILRNQIADNASNAIERLNTLKPLPPRYPKRKHTKSAQKMHLVISDVHCGEYIDPALCANLTGEDGYSFDVFKACADTLEEKVFRWQERYGHTWSINELDISFLGDIVTGEDIYRGQALQIDRIVSDQVFEAAGRFSNMIRNWLTTFKTVRFRAVPGNHGRVGRKGDTHWRTNFDYLASRIVAQQLKGVKGFEAIIAEGPFLIYEDGEWRFLLQHGDAPTLKGITSGSYVGMDRQLAQFSQMAGQVIHYSLCGHHHRAGATSVNGGGKVISNGSWPGGSPFSVEVLSAAMQASQTMFLFDPVNGVHSVTDLILRPQPRLAADKRGMLTPGYRTKG